MKTLQLALHFRCRAVEADTSWSINYNRFSLSVQWQYDQIAFENWRFVTEFLDTENCTHWHSSKLLNVDQTEWRSISECFWSWVRLSSSGDDNVSYKSLWACWSAHLCESSQWWHFSDNVVIITHVKTAYFRRGRFLWMSYVGYYSSVVKYKANSGDYEEKSFFKVEKLLHVTVLLCSQYLL